ncbi:enoyl-CoA hydratase/isomerase family protein [Sciscionella marina]|uniref:enoyl-CoA hydratase/isomerase family protein n=1 Tax=Sciscionella marina TaxID=508770 RepID=UPI00036EEE89|nr:enoyl-CoA hydratase-related protein [Sciscionella marina]
MTEKTDTAQTPVLFSINEGIAEVTLNRPDKMNALTPEMLVRLDRAWHEIQEDQSVRVAVLSGAGTRAFSAGADLSRLTPLQTRARSAEDEWDEALLADPLLLNRALLRDIGITIPVIAAMRGAVVGGGMELMLACDLRIGGESCQFGLLEVRRGLIPAAGGIARVSRQIAQARAAEILLVGDKINADQALSFDLINQVVPDDDVLTRAHALATRMAENGPLAMRKAKQVMLESSGRPILEAFAKEDDAIKEVLRSKDAREGSKAFMEKRAPSFTGE